MRTSRPRRSAAATAVVLLLALLAAVPAAADDDGEVDSALQAGPGDDAVVIAVVDSGFSPYHLDYRADLMPQHLDGDDGNDLPLDTDPSTWLPGYDTSGATSFDRIDLTLTDDTSIPIEQLEDADDVHRQIPESNAGEVHLRWIPGTKIVGAVDFAGGTDGFFATNGTHGNGSASVSTGTQYGSCPECLVVLVRYDGSGQREAASDWAMSQPWIDVVTNSFGFSTVMRDRIYDGANTELQREASERGQTIFFSSGNGQANTFTAPNTTIQSSQEGPDWIITVGGTAPNGANYQGAGKPADVASIGTSYPAGYGGTTIDGRGTFGGTSNATPVTAGIYGRSLWVLRQAMEGPSRTQADGVVAVGELECGDAVESCAAGDGVLTATEMRFGLLHAAVRTPQGLTPAGIVTSNPPSYPAFAEGEFATEGHGTFFGRIAGEEAGLAVLAEEVAGVVGPLAGTREPLERTQDELDWMVVDSWCRQQVHGSWDGGYYVEGETALPPVSASWPVRSALLEGCPTAFGLLKDLG